MKVVHFAVFGPGRSGQYATVKDLIIAERSVGIDAQLVDCNACQTCKQSKVIVGSTDGPIKTVGLEEAKTADILVRHSLIPHEIEQLGIPMVLCLHGRPENSFLLEKYKTVPVYSFLEQVANDDRYKAFVTFWQEYMFHFSKLLPKKQVYYVPSMVNLNEYSPIGKTFNLGKKSGAPNILIADIWREDTTPFNVLFSAVKFREEYCPGAKIHIFGMDSSKKNRASDIVTRRLQLTGALGEVFTLSPDMPERYRAGDILVTPHVIATRVVREALASGLPIVAGTGNKYTQWTANPMDISGFAAEINSCWNYIKHQPDVAINEARELAEKEFNLQQAGEAMKKVFESVLENQTIELQELNELDEDITFMFAAYGDKFMPNVFALLQSIDETYNGKAKIIFGYYDVSDEIIFQIQQVLPGVIIEGLKFPETEDNDEEFKTAAKSIMWNALLHKHPQVDKVVMMDADMLVVKKLGKFFKEDFDIGYTYKLPNDENPHWPLNAGIMLARNTENTKKFLNLWAKTTMNMQKSKLHKRDGYLLWGGGDQVSLGNLLGTRNLKHYAGVMKLNDITLRGFPCKLFNESRCIEPNIDTHVLHYKSKSWQNLLKTGEYSARRPKMLCTTMANIYKNTLKRWVDRASIALDQFKWTPEFELDYWTQHDNETYLNDIERLHKVFDIDSATKKSLVLQDPGIVLEVGGGKMGGELQFYKHGKRRILFDKLADTFKEMGNVPDDVECITGDFDNIPLPDDSVDVIFAWEVLDHAISKEHYTNGQKELTRVLKPDGILFFNHPLRKFPTLGHNVVVDEQEILHGFKELEILFNKPIANAKGHLEYCLIGRKSSKTTMNLETIEHFLKLGTGIKLTSTRYEPVVLSHVLEVDIGRLSCQNIPVSFEKYKTAYGDTDLKDWFSLENSIHCKFLDALKHGQALKESKYFKFQMLLNNDNEQLVLAKCKKFLNLAKDIMESQVNLLPIVYKCDDPNYEYEVYDGHHRLACCIAMGMKTMKLGVLESRPILKGKHEPITK